MSLMDEIRKVREKYPDYLVLYVEDEEKIRTLTQNLLLKFFDHVDIASDGKEGLSMFEKNSYDIVISDLQMPNMNGIEMLKKIRSQNKEVILIAMTAYESGTESEDVTLVCNHYLNKPVSLDNFIKTFNSLQ